jgi:ubiquinone/menaquinone biosynthesis C-methylase UbiE
MAAGADRLGCGPGAGPNVAYFTALAERLPLRDGSVSLVAAAQAAHWFDFERFHAECRRVLVPGGVVAAWTYEKFRADDAVDAVIDDFYERVVGYLGSWSSVQRYRDRHGRDPLPDLRGPLESAWGGTGPKRLRWPIHLRLGRA